MHGDSDSKEVEADVVVTARGLSPLATGGMDLVVHERPVDLAQTATFPSWSTSTEPVRLPCAPPS